MTTFNPGRNTLDRLVELSQEVDFAAFVFAQDDWTNDGYVRRPGQASPRDNVVFEAGLFGGALGIRRTFILHANGVEAADRPSRAYLGPLRPDHQLGGASRHQSEAAQGD